MYNIDLTPYDSGLSGSPWIAIDDDPEHYPAGCEVLLIDPTRGFNREAARDLVTMARRIDAEAPLA